MADAGIPQTLAKAITDDRLVPFVGAGVSMAVTGRDGTRAFPSWHGLLEQAASRIEAEGRTQHMVVNAMLQQAPPDYLGAAEWAHKGLGGQWAAFFKKAIDIRRSQVDDTSLDLARRVWSVGSPLVITTNYDRVLRWSCPEDDPEEWSIEEPVGQVDAMRGTLNRPAVWHLHGSCRDPSKIILCPDGYQKLYTGGALESGYQAALATLRSLMSTHHLLFVGFSLDDEYVVRQLEWARDVFKGASSRHYALARAGEVERMRAKVEGLDVDFVEFEDFGDPLLAKLDELAAVRGQERPVEVRSGSATSSPAVATPSELALPDPVPPQELQRYLERAEARHQDVPLVGFKTKTRLSMQLHELYVPLRAVVDRLGRGSEVFGFGEVDQWCAGPGAELRQEDVNLANAFARASALGGRRGLVLLGDPGSGKTTHLKQMLLKVARVLLGEARGEPDSMGLPQGTVPVFLPLRNFDAGLDLPAFIQQEIDAPGLVPDFGQQLCRRGRLLLLLDGLDEVASASQRAAVSRWVEKLLLDMPQSRVLVSCRYAGYAGEAELNAKFLELHLRPFDDEQMSTFVTRWYEIVEREQCTDAEEAARKATKDAEELIAILKSGEFSSESRLYQMTRNPLLLTTLCLVHHDLGRLPHARARLYEESVTVLLERWRHRFTGKEAGAMPLLTEDALKLLQPVARWMHEQRRKRAGQSELIDPVMQGLGKLRHVKLRAEPFLQMVRDESGLLTGWSGDEYGFMHLGFQEFLTAKRLRNEGIDDPQVFAELAKRFGDSWWQEVILLMLALHDPCVFKQLMRHVVRQPEFGQWVNLEMMGLVFTEAAEVSEAPFVELLEDAKAPAEQRIAAVTLLTRRMPEVIEGNPALKKLRNELMHADGSERARAVKRDLPTIVTPRGGVELVRIPGGSFLMGSPEDEEGRDIYVRHLEPDKRKGHANPEGPRHQVELSSFYLARTPVTNAQYAEFLKDNPKAEKPEHWGDGQYNQPDQPVVGVSWHEAKAYCDWAGLVLPTEAQWEYACRAKTETRYCLGDREEDLARAGWYVENSGPRLHAVGELEPNEFGLYDMHGNVWECCMDAYGLYTTSPRAGDGLRHEPEGDSFRVVRGGCFALDAAGARSAYRYAYHPDSRWRFVGFRPAQVHS